MKFKTFSIAAGSEACNARCPFCVSKMTPKNGVDMKEPEVNWRNFKIAARLAKQTGIETAMITSKGEPTLFPGQITKYLDALAEFEFPFIELQTNGIPIAEKRDKYDQFIREWYKMGLTMPAISIVHYDQEKNRQIYLPHKEKYIDLPELVSYLHNVGFSVRLACVAVDGFIDNKGELEKLIEFARENKVEQLTVRPVNKPEKSINFEAYEWTKNHHLKPTQLEEIKGYLNRNGTGLLELPHGGTVYDINGQNVCLTNSLTRDTDPEKGRQLIFFPDGRIRYDWEKEGAILL
ncbi:MAG: radical SAM protein [Nanoarchaeota archaeon]